MTGKQLAITDDVGTTVAQAAAQLGTMLLQDDDLDEVLDAVARLGGTTIPGAESVSVTVLGDRPSTVAYDAELSLALDEHQYAAGEGPCLDAARTGEVFEVTDAAADTRWPSYLADAVQAGLGSSLSIPLPVRGLQAAINVYARTTNAFGPDAVAAGRELAAVAAVAIGNALAYSKSATLAEQMTEAMLSRSVIEQAKGILMWQNRCSADEAFATLRAASLRSQTKVRDLAAAIVSGITD